MDARVTRCTLYQYPYAFINKRGDPIVIGFLEDKHCQPLVEMYLAYKPRGSFSGLPPHRDEACIRWVRNMITEAINLVALSFAEGVVGHVALFPENATRAELLVVVSPPFQNTGIGTELVRCAIQVGQELDFEEINLTLDATNYRGRHVFRKCGFDYTSTSQAGQVEMAVDLKSYRDTLSVNVSEIMNRNVLAIQPDQPCREALKIFLERHVGSLPVVDREHKLVGIISKTDLLLPGRLEKIVSDVFTRDVLVVHENCPVDKVIRMFQSRRIRAIPVVDRHRRLVGVVGREDILNYYARCQRPSVSGK